ncbi:MAG: cytochrome c oxidase assembly protein [Solirubrobacterales bacterium]
MDRKHATVLASVAAVAAMAGLVGASVPLYNLYCRVTGAGGTTQVQAAAPATASERTVTVRFDASTAKGLPWRFQPEQKQVTLKLGEQGLAFFTATNTSNRPITGTATFNVMPAKAGRYFDKIQCFCFSEQRLEPGQTVSMPVSFYVDPALADDEFANEVTTITLSYTFFEAEKGSEAKKGRGS